MYICSLYLFTQLFVLGLSFSVVFTHKGGESLCLSDNSVTKGYWRFKDVLTKIEKVGHMS